ncbi:MAG: sigma-70 family RNA polymerase sigma factor [Anaerolineales bacterium]|nr:sigma-70 family RNA polymerase sigma factor [Anaerolineales bacterium]
MENRVIAPAAGEETMIAQAVNGDLAAFNQLVLIYQNLAYSVAYRTLQDDAAAADAVQDSFIKAFRAIADFQGGSFKSWIIRIVANTCYDVLRSRRRKLTDSLDDLSEDESYASYLVDPTANPHLDAERMELSALLERSIHALPPDQRLVLTLCDVHGYAYEEIAEMIGAPIGTVKSRINRARAKVRDYLLQHPGLLPSAFRP